LVTASLRRTFPEAEILGYDSALFASCLTSHGPQPEIALSAQYFGDVRDIRAEHLAKVDAVVHLAAVSNDPIGKRFGPVTDSINHRSSLYLAGLARDAGARSFVFASSCSVYGVAEHDIARTEADSVSPQTAYARSKVDTETALRTGAWGDMVVSCLRFATACGWSPRLRLDLVLNDFVASALATGEIEVLSDGTPWRPLVDVRDMARAISWAVDRTEADGGRFLVVNVGSNTANYRIRDLAAAVADNLPGTRVELNERAVPDKRSYRVDFSRFERLAPDHTPRVSLCDTIQSIKAGLAAIGFADAEFRSSRFVRLRMLDELIAHGHLTPELRWTDHGVSR
jgi:nucleoside-diphosphate-sugar epimerase